MAASESPATAVPERDWFIIAVRAAVVVVVAAGWVGYFVYQYGWTLPFTLNGGEHFQAPAANDAPARNSIAYVAGNGEVRVMSADGTESHIVGKTNSATPALTWSRDGRYLAYLTRDRENRSYIMVASTAEGGGEAVDFFRDPARQPIYYAWSPDDTSMAVLLQEDRQMALYIVPVDDPANSMRLTEGPTCYFNWSPEGGALLADVGNTRLSVFDTATGYERLITSEMSLLQTPAWPARNDFYYLANSGTGSEFRRGHFDSVAIERVAEGPWSCRAVASPGGRFLAYSDAPLSRMMPFSSRRPGIAHVVDTTDGSMRTLRGFTAYAFFWSPDGTKLMLIGPAHSPMAGPESTQEDRFPMIGTTETLSLRLHRWWLYDVATDTCVPLIQCRMTREFLQILPYFDQYAHSVQYWAPDSRSFLITARQEEMDVGDVWVLDTEGETPPRLLAEGGAAVWSWQ